MKSSLRENKKRRIRIYEALAMMIFLVFILSSCGKKPADLSIYPEADMSGYAGLKEYEGKAEFRQLTVKDIQNLMEEGESFCFYAGFNDCPWCNAMIETFCRVMEEEGTPVGYLDTRANPDWKSNTEIDDYDIFLELFGEFLDIDSEGSPHLYVPDIYWIKNGQVVKEHQGLVPGIDEPGQKMTDEQVEELKDVYRDGFKLMK